MKMYTCYCGNILFFENSVCLACRREVGWCPVCKGMHALLPQEDGRYTCANPACRAHLVKCHNYAVHNVCNRMIAVATTEPAHTNHGKLCDYCRFNATIPDLSVEGNLAKWYQLEVAKRRLLYTLDVLNLPYGTRADGFELPLSFDFKADIAPASKAWRSSEGGEKVYTGHANGKITINIREADPVEREKLRVNMGETHRTLIGHFRHEIGHYYWQLLVQHKEEDAFKALFGDHTCPSYQQALSYYYKNGPKPYWRQAYISAYATMHPWEDFAETWGAYLDMVSVLDTAENAYLLKPGTDDLASKNFDSMVVSYLQLGIKVNEVNRAMGLMDILPEIFTQPVLQKLKYIHQLIHKARHPASSH
jgi:hypothetical protein